MESKSSTVHIRSWPNLSIHVHNITSTCSRASLKQPTIITNIHVQVRRANIKGRDQYNKLGKRLVWTPKRPLPWHCCKSMLQEQVVLANKQANHTIKQHLCELVSTSSLTFNHLYSYCSEAPWISGQCYNYSRYLKGLYTKKKIPGIS